jgi:hypothetical protein
MPAFYRNSLHGLLSDDDVLIIGRLTSQASQAGFFQQVHAQTTAWLEEIRILKDCARRLLARFQADEWAVLLEYPIPRRGKRIDAVLVTDWAVIVLEFKCGSRDFGRDGLTQVEDYCLDLSAFHKVRAVNAS